MEEERKCTLCGNAVEDLKYVICNSCLEKQRNRKVPGTIINEAREYRYVADDGNDYFTKENRQSKKQCLFEKVIWHILPPIPQNGGAMTENCKLWLPTNELFHALSYRGDIEGWRKQIELGVEQLGLLTGKIVEGNIKLSDGRFFSLSECKIEFY